MGEAHEQNLAKTINVDLASIPVVQSVFCKERQDIQYP